MAFDEASDCLKNNDHHGGRQNLQIMMKFLKRANASYELQTKNDPDLTQELKMLSEDYLTSCDIAQALEALEAGDLITGLATGELEAKDIEAALNHGWNALDRYKEAENLAESTVDDICYRSKVAQALLYQNVFKNTRKAKKIFTAIVRSSASHYHSQKDWYKEAETNLKKIEESEPTFQKAKIMEELQPDHARIKDAVIQSKRDLQTLINFFYTNYPPIAKNDGTPRAMPIVSNVGRVKAIRKMIISYHPDKIDKSDMKYKLLCEEITKVFTDMNK